MDSEWLPVHTVSLIGFVMAAVFGIVANKTNFCVMGAVSDWVNMGHTGRLGAWLLAIAVAIAGTQVLALTGAINLSESMYLSPRLALLGHLVGGLLFGVGMTLAGGCGQRSLVRVGNGSLKSLIVVIILAVSAYATLRGVLGVVRVTVFEPMAVDLTTMGIQQQGLAELSARAITGQPGIVWQIAVAAFVVILLVLAVARMGLFTARDNNLLAGLVVGSCILVGWVLTGVVGRDDFDPVAIQSLTFVAPVGNSLNYLMTFTGASINFGIATVAGVVVGSFGFAVATGRWRVEAFTDKADLIRHLIGAVLMGFGGVLALGCTVGQGITGLSTLALGSVLTTIAIVFGSALTMKVQYRLFDEVSWYSAVSGGLGDVIKGR